MEEKSLILQLVKTVPGTILQVNAGDLSEFAGEIVSGVITALHNANSERKIAEVLTIDEVAEILKVSKMTLHRWDKEGILPKIDIYGQRRYRRTDVDALIDKRKEK